VTRTRLKVAEGAPGFSLLEAEFVNHRYEPHFHDELVVAVTESGTAQINCWGQRFKAGPGAIFLSNPKDPQAAMTSETPWKYRASYLSRTALDQTARVLGLPSFPRLNHGVFQSPLVAGKLLRLHTDMFERQVEDVVAQKLITMFSIIVRERRIDGSPQNLTHPFRFPTPPYRTGFDDALNYLIQNKAENCDLESLSIHLGLSRFQLVRLFNRQVGMPPHAFLVQLRLAKACQLLRAGTSIAAAAADSGFFDQSALTRHFRRSLGVTPRQFREAQAIPAARRWRESNQ
jgi:AraC-like DNA-binding protein